MDMRRLLQVLEPVLLEDIDDCGMGGVFPQRTELLDGQQLLLASRLYLGGEDTAAQLEGVRAERGTVILLADGAAALPPAGCRLLRTSCPLPRLFNTVAAAQAEAATPVHSERDNDSFQQCWERIMERTLTGTEEIRNALDRTPHPPGSFARVALVSFCSCRSYPDCLQLLSQLRDIFPDSNMMLYRKDILVLFTYNERCFRFTIPEEEKLRTLLQDCDGCFCISNGTRNLSVLPILYRQVVQALVLARQVCTNPNQRIFNFEEFSIYCVIDLCAQRFMELYHSDDIIYLIHPAVIQLTRYDRKHKSGLRDVLYYYLRNDRNLIKTAADTYMHRNTVVNKVNRILKLLELDLEDGGLRQRLMFSCQIIRYYEKVMHLELKL